MKIAVVGSSGMVGSRFVEFLDHDFDILKVDRTLGIDITDKESIFEFFKQNTPSIIVHFAAKTNVDGCEEDKIKDLAKINSDKILDKDLKIDFDSIDNLHWKNQNSAFAINVVGAKNLVDYCFATGARLVYVSTDFVFNGKKEYYFEEDKPYAINWYGQTKLWGEDVVREKLAGNHVITRIAYPYGGKHPDRQDFVTRIKNFIAAGNPLSLVYDHIMTPTFIDDIINGLSFMLKERFEGIYHLTGDSYVSPYEVGEMIVNLFGFDKKLISKIKREDFFKGKAKRPFKLRLDNSKVEKLGIKMRSFLDGFNSLKEI